MKNTTSKLLAVTLLTLTVASQSAMAMSQGPSGFEQVLPGNSIESVVFSNDFADTASATNEGSIGYELVLPGYKAQTSMSSVTVSYQQNDASLSADIFDTKR